MGKNIYLCVREARVMMGAKLLYARIRTQTYEMKSILFFFVLDSIIIRNEISHI